MPATTASATVRRVRRASAIGLGLLVSAGALAPPALAAPLPAVGLPVTTDAGVAGTVHVQLAAAPVPTDLDLSGARFDVLGVDGAVVGSCASGASGACDIPMAQYVGKSTTYRLVQEAGSAVPGLVPTSAESTFSLCSPDATDCQNSPITVTDASQFRTGLSVTVRDGDTRAAVTGVEYSLTGPGYPHLPATPQDAETTVFPDPTLSGPDGRLTFAGWFRPGDWALTPEVTARGYQSSGVLPVTLPARTASSGDTWATTVDLAPDPVAPTGTGTGGRPVRPPVLPPAAPGPTTAPALRVPVADPSSASVPSAAPTASAAPTSAAVPMDPGPTDSTATDSAPEPLVGDGNGTSPPNGAAAPTASAPLRAASAASRRGVGVLGFGILFLALVVIGVGSLRWRVRRRLRRRVRSSIPRAAAEG